MNLYRGIERFDERTSSDDPFHEGTSTDPLHESNNSNNLFPKDSEMLGMLHDLQATIEQEQEIKEEGLENSMRLNNGVEEETTNIFQGLLLNQARRGYTPTVQNSHLLTFWL